VQIKILRMFGQEVCQIYQVSSGYGLLNVGNMTKVNANIGC
jgi:hypothetical protein